MRLARCCYLCVFVCFVIVFVVADRSAWAGALTAERILVNGNILTIDSQDSIAEALAIRDGKIVAVGTDEEIEALAGPETERIDLQGLTATPGLLDSHVHLAYGGLNRLLQIDLSYPNAANIGDVVEKVRARSAEVAAGEWVRGAGWDEGKFAELRYIYAADLDPVTRDRPVWLEHTMGHYGTANSVALALAGITKDTPDPPGGTIDRLPDGTPSGVLKENAMGLVRSLIPDPTAEQTREAIRQMARAFNAEGMTGLKDPGIGLGFRGGDSSFDVWRAYQDVLAEGELTVRVVALWPSPPTMEGARKLAARIQPFSRPYVSTGDDRLISGGIKIFADGSGGARTAWMWDDWNKNRTEIDKGNRGYPAIDADLLREQIQFYHDAGLHMGIHAVGDRAIDWVVDSYLSALENHPVRGLRHAILHANIPSDGAIEKMAELQRRYDAGYPEPQPEFTWWIGDTYAGNFGEERSKRLNPFQTYKRKGVKWAGGSDFFVTPFPARYGIWSAMARETLLGVYGDHPFGRDEAIDAKTALRSYTLWAAHQLFLDDKIGSIETGKYADLAVWDTDIYTAPPDAIKNMKCQMTLLEGNVVFVAPGSRLAVSSQQ